MLLLYDWNNILLESIVENSYQGDRFKGFTFGVQLEARFLSNIYIPTNGMQVTRSAETANGSGDAATFNDSEGVLMAEISALADDGTIEGLAYQVE